MLFAQSVIGAVQVELVVMVWDYDSCSCRRLRGGPEDVVSFD